MMSVQELAAMIGQQGTVEVRASDKETFRVAVVVLDVKQAYGHTRALVEPVAGEGRVWVGSERVRMEGA